MSGEQLVIIWALFALAVFGIPGYVLGWWNGRRCLRAALDTRRLPLVADLEVRILAADLLPIAGRLPVSITCPRCGRISYHPEDVAQGYCGNCHDWTSPRRRVSEDPYPTTPLGLWSEHRAQLDADERAIRQQQAETEREIREMTAAAEDPYRRRG